MDLYECFIICWSLGCLYFFMYHANKESKNNDHSHYNSILFKKSTKLLLPNNNDVNDFGTEIWLFKDTKIKLHQNIKFLCHGYMKDSPFQIIRCMKCDDINEEVEIILEKGTLYTNSRSSAEPLILNDDCVVKIPLNTEVILHLDETVNNVKLPSRAICAKIVN